MEERVRKFYRGERINHVVFLSFGAASSLFGFVHYILFTSSFSLGLMVSLGIIGIIQFAHGIFRFWKTFDRYKAAQESCRLKSSYLVQDELSHLEALDKRFSSMRNVESIVFIIGFAIVIVCAGTRSINFLMGAATGITIHAAVMLAFDLLSQFRVKEYLYQIKKLKS